MAQNKVCCFKENKQRGVDNLLCPCGCGNNTLSLDDFLMRLELCIDNWEEELLQKTKGSIN